VHLGWQAAESYVERGVSVAPILRFYPERVETKGSMELELGQPAGNPCGNSGGSPEATRRAFNKRFLLDLAEDWQQHEREVFKRLRRESPAAYLKVCTMLVQRDEARALSAGCRRSTRFRTIQV
jgi:hypothetical protein